MKRGNFNLIVVPSCLLILSLLSCTRFQSRQFTPFAWKGVLQVGAAGKYNVATSVLPDASHNMYVSGFSMDPQTAATQSIISKFDVYGRSVWSVQFGASAPLQTFAYASTSDSTGNLVLTGYTNGGFDGNSLTGVHDLFVTKYGSDGGKQWTRQLGVAGKSAYAFAITRDAGNNIYVAGYTDGGLDGNTLIGVHDAFLTKYSPSGSKLWTVQWGFAAGHVVGQSIACDSAGNVYVIGKTNGGLDGNTLIGKNDLFLSKFDSGGTKQWTKQFGVANSYTLGAGVAVDPAGSIFIVGGTNGSFANAAVGKADMFVTKLDATGSPQWKVQVGVAGQYSGGGSVAIDLADNIYISGSTSGGLDGNRVTGATDAFVTKYTASGQRAWTRQIGSSGQVAYPHALALDALANVIVVGHTSGSFQGVSKSGPYDLFIAMFTKDGVQSGAVPGGSALSAAATITISSGGTLFLMDDDGGYLTDNNGENMLAL